MKVKERKLGREKAWGLAHQDENLIEIDPRLKGKKRMEITVHEALHLIFPTLSETDVIRHSKKLTGLLWKENYRKVETNTK